MKLITLMPTLDLVQTDLIEFAVQIPASCIYNSYLCSKKDDLIFDLHFIDVGVGKYRIAFVSF